MSIGQWSHEDFIAQVLKFHGHAAPGVIIGGYMVEKARRALPGGILFDAVSETVQCLPDAVQMLTPCTVGNGWLRICNFGIYALSLYDKYTGEGVRVRLDVDKLDRWPHTRIWLLKEKPKSEQEPELLRAEMAEAAMDMLSLSKIQIRPELLRRKGKGAIVRCPLCSEWYPAAFGRICRSCQGDSPYEQGPGLAFQEPRLTAVPVEQAVGQHVLHDMTKIVPQQSKGAVFKAGQNIDVGDICRLQQMGRFRVYTEEAAGDNPDFVHEDAAVRAFAELMPGEGVAPQGEPSEGKINFRAERDGLFEVDRERLAAFNMLPDVMCATRHGMSVVRKGARLAGSRAIPLLLARPVFLKALSLLDGGPLFRVRPMRKARVGTLVTGTEVFQGLIQDRFAPIIRQKAENLGCTVVGERVAPDDAPAIGAALAQLLDLGADLIITTAGLSVDPDDVTRKALLDAGLTDLSFGLPVLPGTMTLLGRIGGAQVLGVPACALFYKTTALDLMLPRLLANVPMSRADLALLGHGGLCLECTSCDFPKCTFGR